MFFLGGGRSDSEVKNKKNKNHLKDLTLLIFSDLSRQIQINLNVGAFFCKVSGTQNKILGNKVEKGS